MAKDSRIEWTHHTFNPWWGCTKISPGCKNCYAEAWAKRTGSKVWGPKVPRRQLSDQYWRQPIAWNEEAVRKNTRYRVFCASMSDVFEDRRDLDESRARLWPIIEATPALDWLLLTKRPQNMRRLAPWRQWPSNAWAGATAENQKWLEKRINHLLSVPAAVHFLSAEPLLGHLNIEQWLRGNGLNGNSISWVIAGGESGGNARHMNPEWVTSIRDQCNRAGASFLFKQWGNWKPVPANEVNGYRSKAIFLSTGESIVLANMGKKKAGRDLEGRIWDQLPFGTV